MSWLQSHAITVPSSRTTTTETFANRHATTLLFQITLTPCNRDDAAQCASISIDRPIIAFHSLRDELLRLTQPPATSTNSKRKKIEWMRRIVKSTTRSSRTVSCSCEAPAPCPFQKIHDNIQTMEPLPACSSSYFLRRSSSDRNMGSEPRRRALETWMQSLHSAFAGFSTSMLQAKYQRSDCHVMNAYVSFLSARVHFRVLDAAALRQPLALRAWHAEREQAASAVLSLVEESEKQGREPVDEEPLVEELNPAEQVNSDHSLLPRLEVKPVGLATLQTFLEDFCDTLLSQYGQDIQELHSPDLTMARRWEICLYVACRIGHSYGAQLILFYYADANVAMEDGTSCLHIAARMGRTAIVTMLLSEGANVNRANCSGITPLIAACRNGCLEVATLLVANGAAVCMASVRGTHPLHAAIVSQSVEIVQLLLANGANVRATTVSGLTPLHFAAKLGSVELTELLLRHHADPEQQTKSGSDAIMIAETNGHFEICELFQKEMDRKNVLSNSGGKLFHRFKKQQTQTTAANSTSSSHYTRTSTGGVFGLTLRSSGSQRLSLEESNGVILLSDRTSRQVDAILG